MTPTHPDNTSAHSAFTTPRVSRSQSVVESKALDQACAQFNAGEFFACHETLEPLWLAAKGIERIFWHALIQAAVALHHHQRGNKKGRAQLTHTRTKQLSNLPHLMHNLDLRQFSLAP